MTYRTLISPADLLPHLSDPDWVIVDCRFSLDRTERGREDYRREHVPGAVYAHLNEDLSGEIIPGKTGRHPLPSPEAAAEIFSSWGISEGVQVVAYDDAGGSIASRLWWMLRWLGHETVAVLDGGWPAWKEAGYPAEEISATRARREFRAVPHPEYVAALNEVEQAATSGAVLLDARALTRYRGEVEPIDPVAGHIPGALCAAFSDNLDASGRFKSPEALRMRFESLLNGKPAAQAIGYCGSGVTATHNLLALEHAGISGARLYPGSWSEWITDPNRPIRTGDE